MLSIVNQLYVYVIVPMPVGVNIYFFNSISTIVDSILDKHAVKRNWIFVQRLKMLRNS